MNCTIGVDIGSSSIKAVLFAPEIPVVLKSERRPLMSRFPSLIPGRFEEDPYAIRTEVFEVLLVLAQFAREQNHKIKAIAFTGQMHGGLVVDSNLRPLTNFITWQDKRGDERAPSGKTFVEELSGKTTHDPTGVGIHTGFLITTLCWFARTATPIPGTGPDAKIIGIYDWLTSLLLGRAVTDISSAAACGMYDPISFEWRNELLEAANIDQTMLPEIEEPGKDLGAIDSIIASELSLDKGVHIHASIGDTQAAYIGAECSPDEVLLNIGTGSQSMWEMGVHSGREPSEGTDIRYLRRGRYIACAPTLAGGEAYRVAGEFFREVVHVFAGIEVTIEDTFAVLDRIAEESSSQGMKIDPIFQGSKFRGDLERGSAVGINSDYFHPGPFARALVEGMIEEIAWPYFERRDSSRHTGLAGAGGAIRRNSVLRLVAAKRFDLPLRLGRFDNEAAVGAAMLCGK